MSEIFKRKCNTINIIIQHTKPPRTLMIYFLTIYIFIVLVNIRNICARCSHCGLVGQTDYKIYHNIFENEGTQDTLTKKLLYISGIGNKNVHSLSLYFIYTMSTDKHNTWFCFSILNNKHVLLPIPWKDFTWNISSLHYCCCCCFLFCWDFKSRINTVKVICGRVTRTTCSVLNRTRPTPPTPKKGIV